MALLSPMENMGILQLEDYHFIEWNTVNEKNKVYAYFMHIWGTENVISWAFLRHGNSRDTS